MDALASTLAGAAVTPDAAAEREFEDRLADSSALAFRIAYSVVRNREDDPVSGRVIRVDVTLNVVK